MNTEGRAAPKGKLRITVRRKNPTLKQRIADFARSLRQ